MARVAQLADPGSRTASPKKAPTTGPPQYLAYSELLRPHVPTTISEQSNGKMIVFVFLLLRGALYYILHANDSLAVSSHNLRYKKKSEWLCPPDMIVTIILVNSGLLRHVFGASSLTCR